MGMIRHLVRTVDFGSVQKQQLNYLRMTSSSRPDDGVDAVLLGQTQINYKPQTTLNSQKQQGRFSAHVSEWTAGATWQTSSVTVYKVEQISDAGRG